MQRQTYCSQYSPSPNQQVFTLTSSCRVSNQQDISCIEIVEIRLGTKLHNTSKSIILITMTFCCVNTCILRICLLLFLTNCITVLQHLHNAVYISQLIQYSRACGSYHDFLDRWLLLTRKLLNQGFLLAKLKSPLRKFYDRHRDLIDRYGISVS